MRKWLVLVLIAFVSASVQAKSDEVSTKKSKVVAKKEKPQGESKRQFIKKRLKWARNDRPNANQKKLRENFSKKFDEMDLDDDGYLSDDEKAKSKKPRKSKKVGGNQTAGESKKAYVKKRLTWAEEDPKWNPTEESLADKFDKLDLDGDGYLSDDEKKTTKVKQKKNPRSKAKKARRVRGKKKASSGESKKEYIEKRLSWAEEDPTWNPTEERLGKKFDKLDLDGDGYLSDDEK